MTQLSPQLSIQNLTFGYNGAPLLPAPFQATLPAGLHFLLGRNGAGKSTLLRTIGGLHPALSGQCYLQQHPLHRLPPPQRARWVSLSTTARLSVPFLSVAELLELGRAPYTGRWGQLSTHDRTAIARNVAALDLGHLLERDMQELSDGERQQVWVARALVQDTPLVLLDEPSHHLDVVNRLRLFKQLHQIALLDQKIILVATHEIETALRIGTSFLVLQKGHSLEHVDWDALRQKDLIQAAFGAPGMWFDYNQKRFEWEQ